MSQFSDIFVYSETALGKLLGNFEMPSYAFERDLDNYQIL